MMDVTPCREKWKGTMTQRERFNAQMHYGAFDRCVNVEFGFWDENFTEWKMFRDNNISSNNEAHEFFNFDIMPSVGGKTWINPPFKDEVIEETDDKKVVRDGNGAIGEIPKDGHSTIPHFIDTTVKTPDDWKKVKEERFRVDDPERKVDVEKIKSVHPPDRDYPLGVNCGSMIGRIREMLSIEGLAFSVVDYPDMVEDMVETCCQLTENVLDQLLPHFDFDFASGWEDISCNTGPLVSMDFFENVVVPRYKRIGKKLNQNGIDIWYTDSDGDVRPLIPHFMEAGLNTMFPWEVNGCGHPGETLDEYGKDLRILGGVDKMQLRKGKDAIKEYLESLVPYVERGGFIPHVDHRCPPDVAEEDYIYYLDLKEKLFSL